MKTALITGSGGLIGSESVCFFSEKGFRTVGIDNNMRRSYFGDEASTLSNADCVKNSVRGYKHHAVDIRDISAMKEIFKRHSGDLEIIIHTAAQPSHDWAAKEPLTDFTVNANGTLNLLELTRTYCPGAVFIYTSSNKVYGDTPNRLPLVELESRWEIKEAHPYYRRGIDENMSIDRSMHSLMGASKSAADIMVQEYGMYFDMKTVSFRCGCMTGPRHEGVSAHGFLSYLMKCAVTGEKYVICGYKGKQVRDNMHSRDLVNMFWHYYLDPRPGEVYNAGGGRGLSCSILEAVEICEDLIGCKMNLAYTDENRKGDHIWWISDTSKFKRHYPGWGCAFSMENIFRQLHNAMKEKFAGR